MVEEKHFTDETALAKSSELAKTMAATPSIDLLPTFLTQLELEILNLLLLWQTDLAQKYIENVIQTVYIFDRAVRPEIRDTYLSGLPMDPFLKGFLSLFLAYKGLAGRPEGLYVRKSMDPDTERKVVAVILKNRYFTPDDKMPVEKKRLTLVTEINRIVSKPLAIPSHRAISNALLNLEAHKLIDRKTTITKTFWQINLNFYQHWRECHNQLVAKFEKYKKESKATDKDIDAMKTMLNEYPRILLEFYNIEYWKYFNNEELTSLVLKYREDLMKLTRY